MDLISLIIPCYNEQESIKIFYETTNDVISQIPNCSFEYIFVDDGSKDETLNVIKQLSFYDKRVRYISFSRNFGKESALLAGLKAAKGDYVTIMDADLQDPPALLPQMYSAVKNEGYESVATRRKTRKGEPLIRSLFARLFYKIMKKISDAQLENGARDYRMMSRKFVNAVLSLSEKNRFTKGIFGWVGFKTKWLDFENVKRVAGKTKWSFKNLFSYSLEGIISFSDFLLNMAIFFGIIMTISGVASHMVTAIIAINKHVSENAWIINTVVLVGGIITFFIGIVGLYIGKIFKEAKNRPLYIINETDAGEDQNGTN